MLSQTKENIQNIVNKIQVLDFALNTLNLSHKDSAAEVENLFRRASAHKLKLISELLSLEGAGEVVEAEVIDGEAK